MQWRNEAGGYLREILTARVYDVAVRKQGARATLMSHRISQTSWVMKYCLGSGTLPVCLLAAHPAVATQ